MKAAIVVLLVLVLFAGEAAAQSPARSFAELGRKLTRGDRVLLVDEHGRKALGEVVALRRDEIEIEVARHGRWRWLGGHDPRFVFSEDSVRSISGDDSSCNGKLIGFGIGLAAFAFTVRRANNPQLGYASFLFPGIGRAIGAAVDERHRQLLYVSPRAPVSTARPLGVGIGGTIRF